MWPQYKDWIYHGERPVYAPIEGSNSNPPAANAGASTDQGGNMQAMLCDLFGMHDVREENCEPHPEVHGHEENLADDKANIEGDNWKKYEDLLKKANNPLHDKTRHSKLSTTVNLYNLKCMGGVGNTAFSAFLKFFNQLLPDDGETLSVNTYEAKKILRDMGLRYEKILAYRNDCILF
jgi:hypothetical protein